MAEYERSRTMPAPPEHVFDQAATAGQAAQWLPNELRATEQRSSASDGDGDVDVPELRPLKGELRLEWGAIRDDGYTGWLQVAEHEGGSSKVTAHCSFAGESDPGAQVAHEALDRTLERLEEQVRLRIDGAAG
ncbi:SRPBCC family protein [Streptomyces sp. NPDC102278]|uniref:SRPBCC family protein n=1 Tax=Streptomyces sp. NPDC102278 TaxID=3366152 RepID=UPI0038148991